jgi:hypothetical protein
VKVVVLMRAEGGGVVEGGVERWEEEVGWERGWEVVDAEGEGRNEFGGEFGFLACYCFGCFGAFLSLACGFRRFRFSVSR